MEPPGRVAVLASWVTRKGNVMLYRTPIEAQMRGDRLDAVSGIIEEFGFESAKLVGWTGVTLYLQTRGGTRTAHGDWVHVSEVYGDVEFEIRARCSAVRELLKTAPRGFVGPRSRMVLYHGTTERKAARILKDGFAPPEHAEHDGCMCSMLGVRSIYFAHRTKAVDYARRRPDFKPLDGPGALVRVILDTERCKVRDRAPECRCGCGQGYVDHPGDWMRSGASMLWLRSGSIPATRRPEMAVVDRSCIDAVDIDMEIETVLDRGARVRGGNRSRNMNSI